MAESDAPEYQDLFPGLPSASKAQASSTPSIKSSTVTDGLSITIEEQKFADEKPAFGNRGTKQSEKISYIKELTGAKILVSTSADKTLTFIISGKEKAVRDAKNELMKGLQKEASVTFTIPQEHHRMIIGKGGSKLKEIQAETGTFIKLNKGEDEIRINGNSAGCRKAKQIIETMSADELKKDRVVLEVVQAYHALIAGHKSETIKRIREETGVAIHIPPRDVEKDEIAISGERVAVARAAAEIQAIYDLKRQTCGELTARVPKHKHKYVIGPKGVNLHEIMERFQVVVDIPPADTEEDMLVLRGNQASLVHALTCVYEMADSVIEDAVRIPNWIHRHIIGKKGVGIKKLSEDAPQLNINFPDDSAGDEVSLTGPPEQVAVAKSKLYALTAELLGKMSFVDLKVDPKNFPKLIGKGGAAIKKIKAATEVQIDFAEKGDKKGDDNIHIEGSPEGVVKAKLMILDAVSKIENEKEAELEVNHRFHSIIIGQDGKKIKEILAACPEVTVDFPSKADTSNDTIKLRGPSNEVALAEFSLKAAIATIESENFVVEVAIFKAFHRSVIGQKGVTINAIKDATNCRIDVPEQSDASDIITVTGKKADTAKAKAMILKVQSDIAVIVDASVAIGKGEMKSIKGKVTEHVASSCGGVLVAENAGGYSIKGPEEAVAKAQAMFNTFVDIIKEGGSSEIMSVPAKHHRHIIGRNQVGLKALESAHDVVCLFPATKTKGAAADSVTVFGKRTDVGAAKLAITARVTALEDITEDTLDVEKVYQKQFFARKGEFLDRVKGDCGGVAVNMPKDGTTTLKLKGGKMDVAKAKEMIVKFVEDFKARVTMECVIPSAFHRRLIGPGGEKIRALQTEHNVVVKFPDPKKGNNHGGRKPVAVKKAAPKKVAEGGEEGGDDAAAAAAAPAAEEAAAPAPAEPAGPSKADIVKVSGTEPNVKAAIAELEASVPQKKVLEIDADLHRFIIGSRGEGIRKMMEKYDVFVKFPNAGSSSTQVRVEGSADNIVAFETALNELIVELEATKAERELKSFKVVLDIAPELHQKLIGKAGANITKLREDHDVQVDFPNRKKKLSETDAKKVVITGLQENAEAAGVDMQAQADKWAGLKTLVLKLQNGCHGNIIGSGGSKIKELQKKFDVRITLPRDGGEEVVIEGSKEACLDCQEALLDIEEEWEQEEAEYGRKGDGGGGGGGGKVDKESAFNSELSAYVKPRYSEQQREKAAVKKATKMPKMSGAPWQGQSTTAFPGLGGKAAGSAVVTGPWGQRVKVTGRGGATKGGKRK